MVPTCIFIFYKYDKLILQYPTYEIYKPPLSVIGLLSICMQFPIGFES